MLKWITLQQPDIKHHPYIHFTHAATELVVQHSCEEKYAHTTRERKLACRIVQGKNRQKSGGESAIKQCILMFVGSER